MYQLHLTVREYVGTVGVSAVLSDVDETGHVSLVAQADERFFEPAHGSDDPLTDLYRAVVHWCRLSE